MNEALIVLSTYDEGPDLVLFYKYLLVLLGDEKYQYHFIPTDRLSDSQSNLLSSNCGYSMAWWEAWEGKLIPVELMTTVFDIELLQSQQVVGLY